MGLLDSLHYGNQGGYGGLLDMLMYQGPLHNQGQQAQPDTMAGLMPPAPDSGWARPNPFDPAPPITQQPAPSIFNHGTSPVAGLPSGAPAAPPLPPAQNIPPAPQVANSPGTQVNDMQIGGYSMPRMGAVSDYTPQATDFSAQSRPQQPAAQQMMPPQQMPPAIAENRGGIGSAFRGFAQNAHAGPIGALIGAIGGGLGMEGPEKQNLRAQYAALVPMLGPQKAMLAVMNPEAGKLLIEQAVGSKQKFTEIGVDSAGAKQYGFVNDREQTVKPYNSPGGGQASTSIPGPDGKPISIPEGLDPGARKIFVNEIARINADAAAGKKTGEQATAEIFANKMELSNKTLDTLANQGTSLAGKIASGVPLGNYMQSAEYQKYKQAASNFITALLRKESGAAIHKEEWVRYDTEYMPQPGDGPGVLAQKAEARRVAIDAMKKGAGPGYKSPTEGAQNNLPAGWSVKVR